MALFSKRISELEGQVSERDGTILTLTTERDGANTARDEALSQVTEMETEIEGLQAEVAKLTKSVGDANASNAEFEIKVNKEVARQVAAAGGDPVKISVTKKETPEDDLSNLKGLARTRAAIARNLKGTK